MNSSLILCSKNKQINKNNKIFNKNYKINKNYNKLKKDFKMDYKNTTQRKLKKNCTTLLPKNQKTNSANCSFLLSSSSSLSSCTVCPKVLTKNSINTNLLNKNNCNNKNNFKENPIQKYEAFNTKTTSKAKFCIYLLILLVAIAVRSSHAIPVPTAGSRLILHLPEYRQQRHQELLQQQRSLVLPTPHRHHSQRRSLRRMEDETNNIGDHGDIDEQCNFLNEKLKQSLTNAKMQANATLYHLSNNSLPLYMEAIHGQSAEEFFNQWQYHYLNLEYPYKDYVKNVNNLIHLSEQKLTKEMLQTEFQYIWQTLHNLGRVYDEVQKSQERERKNDPIHDLRRGNESQEKAQARLEVIRKAFKEAIEYLNQDFYQANQALNVLEADQPEVIEMSFNRELQHIEAHLFREHLQIMEYLLKIYTYILEKCSHTSE